MNWTKLSIRSGVAKIESKLSGLDLNRHSVRRRRREIDGAHAFAPKAPRARTSTPTRMMAASTRPLAPPGKVLSFRCRLRGLENFQMKMAKMICAARNDTPASIMVSDIWLSIMCP